MGLDLQPDELTAGLAGYCQPDKKYLYRMDLSDSRKEKEVFCTSASRETISHPN